ncbi:transposase, partial [Vreelandella aquamarina]|uniref:IS701 family transposase n=1 Tax=Vreelandella aquamarina TaxID=77097 RepID=UPI0005CB99AE
TRSRLEGRKITVVIDETGDRKKGKTTDYVSRQYLGSVGKIDNGMVSVNAYGIYENMTFPLLNQVFKPQKRLKESDSYKSQIKIASEIVSKLVESGFKIELVLADSLYGESSQFIKTLEKHNLPWVVAIRSNHGVWMPSHQQVRSNRWSQFQREFSEGKSEIRYIREIIYGRRQSITYWEVTTDPET